MTRKVKLENIVSCQGDDYNTLCVDIDPHYGIEGPVAAWIDNDKLFEYLLQWWQPGEHDTNVYNADDINTPFLGYEYKYQDMTFLLSHNSSMGYAALSRIIEFIEEDNEMLFMYDMYDDKLV